MTGKLKDFIVTLKEKYIYYFKFKPEDYGAVCDKRNRHVLWTMMFIFLLNTVVMCLGFSMGKLQIQFLDTYLFYVLQLSSCVISVVVLSLCGRKKYSYAVRSIPTYFTVVLFMALILFIYLRYEISISSYIQFADFGLIFILLFEVNPVAMTIVILVMDVVFCTQEYLILATLNISVFCVILIILLWWKRFTKVRNLRMQHAVELEKKKNEELLLNILPLKIVEELKATGTTIPEKFEEVSVMFTDFVGFTHTSENLSPEKIISELNDIFTAFDSISEKYGCTRIKTIGDAYLVVCGLPEKDSCHAEKILRCGQEFLQCLEERNESSPVKWHMRIGIHSGPVMAGVVGTEKYQYDIFGDTVNVASRMESNSLPDRINVSPQTRALLEDRFDFEERTPVEVKGKGLMTMYLLK